MDVTPPPQARRGPATRAHARAVETEVNSFLFESHSDSHETRILPHMETLCMLRYFRDRQEKARRDHQVHRRATEEEERNETNGKGGALDAPGDRPLRPRVP